jgi:hypothetical protein
VLITRLDAPAAIESPVNSFVSRLRFVVGFGLSACVSSNYVQGFYSNLDKKIMFKNINSLQKKFSEFVNL